MAMGGAQPSTNPCRLGYQPVVATPPTTAMNGTDLTEQLDRGRAFASASFLVRTVVAAAGPSARITDRLQHHEAAARPALQQP